MKRYLLATAMIAVAVAPLAYVAAHCEVPCGIYDDDRRFVDMLEDQTTIAKAIAGIRDLSGGLSDQQDATALNQLSRWVATKEDHATKLQHTIAQYFMTQRLKPEDPHYVAKLTAAHRVMVAAMKCKQGAEPAAAAALEAAINDFRQAYAKS